MNIFNNTEDRYAEQKKIKPYFVIAVLIWAIFLVFVIIYSFRVSNVDATILPEEVVEYEIIIEELQKSEEVTEPVYEINRTEVEMLARLAWGEARGCTTTEQAAVMWCVLNRVDSNNPDFENTIAKVITQKHQFYYSKDFPLEDKLVLLAEDVLCRWYKEKDTGEIDGRVLPQGYCWFLGDGYHNNFRNAYNSGTTWDWSLPSPYEDN